MLYLGFYFVFLSQLIDLLEMGKMVNFKGF